MTKNLTIWRNIDQLFGTDTQRDKHMDNATTRLNWHLAGSVDKKR